MTRPKNAIIVSEIVGPEEFSARQASELRRLTERFFALREQLSRDAVETIREIGQLLERGSEMLPRGSYGRWIDETLHVGRTAAKNYRRVAELGRSSPALFIKHKDLGPSKIIRLSRVKTDKRKTALKQKLKGKTVAEMTDAEFSIVTKKYLVRTRTVTGNQRAHGLRMKVQAITSKLHEALGYPYPDNPETRAALLAELAELVRAAKDVSKKLRAGGR